MPTNVHWFRHWSLKEAEGQNLTLNVCRIQLCKRLQKYQRLYKLRLTSPWICPLDLSSSVDASNQTKNHIFVCKNWSGRTKGAEFCKYSYYSSLSLTSSNPSCSHQLKRTSSSSKLYSQGKNAETYPSGELCCILWNAWPWLCWKRRQHDFMVRTKIANQESWVHWQNLPNFIKASLRVAANSPNYMGTLECIARNKCSGTGKWKLPLAASSSCHVSSPASSSRSRKYACCKRMKSLIYSEDFGSQNRLRTENPLML